MTFNEFYKKYLEHVSEIPQRKPLAFAGYELHYANGDVYRFEERLKPGVKIGRDGCQWYHFDEPRATWNGVLIQIAE